ncbi:MAG: DUF4139 domain-containing protein [bacterium]|nr:DUF4139 domain-containing protein [bacterium]
MKKKLCLLLLSTVFGLSAFAAKPSQAKIQKITVYLQGAHLYYNETVNLTAGNNELIFENISPYIQASTLQANSLGGVLMEVIHQVKYREKKTKPNQYAREIALILDSLQENIYDLKDNANRLSVLEQEKKMLLNNRLIRGDSPKDSLPLLKQSMEFIRLKLNEILASELNLARTNDKLNKEKNRLNNRHQQLVLLQEGSIDPDGIQATPIQQVVVTVYAEQAMQAQVQFNYFIQQAGWAPNYDLQANASTNQIRVKYFAHVTQQSGLDWKQANLTLSTSSPMELNIKPELATWFVGFIEYKRTKAITMSANKAMTLQASPQRLSLDKEKSAREDLATMDEQKELSDYIEITENLIRTEYEIKLKYEIDSDGKFHKVLIKEQNIPMNLAFAAVPKLSQDAFLMGRISGWEDLNLLPGTARIYFDGGYVGETYLNNQSTSDTLDINLGRDKSLVITRKKVKEKTKVRNFETERVETRTIELIVRNTKSSNVEINLEDQIPVVQGTNEIKVSLLNGDGAQLNEVTGLLKWNFKLASKETKKLSFTYEIRYPKTRQVYGL